MLTSFCRRLSVIKRRINLNLPKFIKEALAQYTVNNSCFQTVNLSQSNMPPKRKIATTKAEAVDQEDGLPESSTKAKKGRATKEEKEPEVVEKVKKGRPKKQEKVEEPEDKVEEEKEKKGAKQKALAAGEKKEKEPADKDNKKKAAKPVPEAKEEKPESKRSARVKTVKKYEEVDEDEEEIESKVTKRKGKKGQEEEESNGVEKKKPGRKKKSDLPSAEPKAKSQKKAPAKEEKEAAAPLNATATNWDSIDFSCTKKNGHGEDPNLTISSWNVGGLKSWVKKDCQKFLEYEKPDIICLQETKCSEEKLPQEIKDLEEEYKQYWCSSDKEGYAGVGLLTKNAPLDVKYGIDVEELDEDGRCITAEFEKFYLVCVYVPNAGRKLVTLPKRLAWNAAFKDFIKALDEKKPVIICGDMNVAHEEIDLAKPQSNQKNAGFTKEEREGMTDFLGDGYVDVFRKLYPDKEDTYTFWTYMMNARSKNIGWRLDYFLTSERIIDNVCDTVIRTEVLGSDHCPLTVFVNI